MNKFATAALSAISGIFAGCVVAALVMSLRMPLFYVDSTKAITHVIYGIPIVIFVYQLVPIASLSFLVIRGKRQITLQSCILVTVVWLVLFLLFWHRRTILNMEVFPVWAVKRDFIPILAIMLATAWGFWRAWSRIGPNHALKADLGDASRPSSP